MRRPDADWLRSVREGCMSYDELLIWVNDKTARLPELEQTSPLPAEPDRAGFEALVVELQESFLFGTSPNPRRESEA